MRYYNQAGKGYPAVKTIIVSHLLLTKARSNSIITTRNRVLQYYFPDRSERLTPKRFPVVVTFFNLIYTFYFFLKGGRAIKHRRSWQKITQRIWSCPSKAIKRPVKSKNNTRHLHNIIYGQTGCSFNKRVVIVVTV